MSTIPTWVPQTYKYSRVKKFPTTTPLIWGIRYSHLVICSFLNPKSITNIGDLSEGMRSKKNENNIEPWLNFHYIDVLCAPTVSSSLPTSC